MPIFHVRPVPHGGGWQINRDNEPFALQTFRFRHQAITEARKLRGREPGEIRVYGADGHYQFSEIAPWLDD